MWVFLYIYFKCGKTNVSVYLYNSVRIKPFPIHSSSHAFHLLIFLLTGCSLHDTHFLLPVVERALKKHTQVKVPLPSKKCSVS